jgi:Uma2 family endonuclease
MTAVASKFEGMIALAFPGKGMSDDQFFEFCQLNRDLKIERTAKGEIIIMSPTGGETGNWNAALTAVLFNWNFKKKLGRTFDSSTGFKLPTGATYGPDSAWITNEKWSTLSPAERKKFLPVVPDFIAEIRSENDNLQPIKEKIAEFMGCGCRLAWLIDSKNGVTYTYKADGSETKVPFNQLLTGEDVLPSFEVKLADLFE